MLHLTIPKQEFYDEKHGEFFTKGPYKLTMEHSLLSISKWESKWEKPFLNNPEDKTSEELYHYFKCMTVNGKDDDDEIYRLFSNEQIEQINDYISAPMTGTKFYNFQDGKGPSHRPISSEEIYYKMFSYNIPMECQKWHINRLLTLLRVFDVKNSDQKMSKAEASAAYRRLNAERRKKMNSKG